MRPPGGAGFTLVEMLITMAIIALFTVIATPNVSRGGKVLALQRAGFLLAGEIRETQGKAIAGETLPDGSFPAGGYGVYFTEADTDSFRVFADINDNKAYDAGEELEDAQGNVDRGFGESNVVIDDLGIATTLSVVFTPPDPSTTITPSSPQAEITLRAQGTVGTTPKLKVIVNKAGLVSVDESP